MAVVFFDLGDTLGKPRVSSASGRLEGFDVFPFVPELLEGLRQAGHRLGIISNTGQEKAADMARKELAMMGPLTLIPSGRVAGPVGGLSDRSVMVHPAVGASAPSLLPRHGLTATASTPSRPLALSPPNPSTVIVPL